MVFGVLVCIRFYFVILLWVFWVFVFAFVCRFGFCCFVVAVICRFGCVRWVFTVGMIVFVGICLWGVCLDVVLRWCLVYLDLFCVIVWYDCLLVCELWMTGRVWF